VPRRRPPPVASVGATRNIAPCEPDPRSCRKAIADTESGAPVAGAAVPERQKAPFGMDILHLSRECAPDAFSPHGGIASRGVGDAADVLRKGLHAQSRAAAKASPRQRSSIFTGKNYSGVAAIHTRNQAAEIHYHADALFGKLAEHRETGCVVSL